MGIYLNRGRDDFERILNSEIYVDKTEMIQFFSNSVETEQAYICVSRPRRFGKTSAANMVATYFEKGANARELFEGRKISQFDNWDKNLGKYDVIRIDLAGMRSSCDGPEETLDLLEENVCKELSDTFSEVNLTNCKSLVDVLATINDVTGAKFIIIIDEWDTFFRDEKSDGKVQERYVNLLRSLFKDNRSKKFTALAYITGILPIKKYNSESALNNFREFTMITPKRLAKYIGFSETEVKELCDAYDMDYEEVCSWYDGYQFGEDEHIFGPNSVVQAMLDGECNNYWSQTVAFNSLATYISMNFDGLKDAIKALLTGEKRRVLVRTYQNDMTSFRSKDDVLTVLIHLGYLAYDKKTEEAFIPNKEVRMCFEDTLRSTDWTEVLDAMDSSEKLMKALLKKDEETVAEGIEKCHRENTSILQYNDENSLSMVLNLAFYSARKDYVIVREMPAGEGFADLVFVPKRGNANPAILLELKWDKSVTTALTQIREKKYPECLEGYGGEVILVGVNYEKANKKHECRIETVRPVL